MNYFSHNIGDYAQATMHLSLVEDAVYSRLLRRYYAEETPLIDDQAQLCRWVGARAEEEREAVEVVLKEFFELRDGYWHNSRADREIEAYRAKSTKAAESAAKRWQPKPEQKENDPHCEGNATAMPTHTEGNANQEPITINQEPLKEKTKQKSPAAARPASLSVSDLVAHGVDAQVADEFLAIRKRKRAVLTSLALEGIRREAGRAGITLDAALRKCVERGWQGFEAAWMKNDRAAMAAGASQHGNFAKQDYHAGVGADGSF
ncbi:YdaU family protein [Parapusillimonas sp. JC17]|uniref:YdaU family protein n=1 Tax=Parapusillimonas sp. JC17 TaxID=3445768 RepID=UPI003F9ED586